MICRKAIYFIDSEMTEYYKKSAVEMASIQKMKTRYKITPDALCYKKSVLMAYVGMYGCHENIKTYKKKMIVKFNYIF